MKLEKKVERSKYLKIGVEYVLKDEDIYLYGYRGEDCSL